MAKYGIKTSRSGSAKTSDTRLLTITSEKNMLKVSTSGSGTITLPGGGGSTITQEVTHNLGYKPSFCAWMATSAGKWVQLPSVYYNTWAVRGSASHVNDNVIRLTFLNDIGYPSGTPQKISYFYMIFIEPRLDGWY